jgi:hypothetical protein
MNYFEEGSMGYACVNVTNVLCKQRHQKPTIYKKSMLIHVDDYIWYFFLNNKYVKKQI